MRFVYIFLLYIFISHLIWNSFIGCCESLKKSAIFRKFTPNRSRFAIDEDTKRSIWESAPTKRSIKRGSNSSNQELCLADIKIHKLCQFIESYGLKTPPAFATLSSLNKTTEDLFTSIQMQLELRIQISPTTCKEYSHN